MCGGTFISREGINEATPNATATAVIIFPPIIPALQVDGSSGDDVAGIFFRVASGTSRRVDERVITIILQEKTRLGASGLRRSSVLGVVAVIEPKSSKLVASGAVFFPLFFFLPFPPFIQNVTALQRRATPRHTRAPPARAPPARPLLTNSPARHPSCRSWPRCFLHSRRLPSKGPSAPLRTSCERRCASGVENVASPSVECPLFLSNNLVEVSILPEKRC